MPRRGILGNSYTSSCISVPPATRCGRACIYTPGSLELHVVVAHGYAGERIAPSRVPKPSPHAQRQVAPAAAPSSQASQRIGTSAPPSGRSFSSPCSWGTGSDEPQPGQAKPSSRTTLLRQRSCDSVSRSFLATYLVYPIPTNRRYFLPFSPECVEGVLFEVRIRHPESPDPCAGAVP